LYWRLPVIWVNPLTYFVFQLLLEAIIYENKVYISIAL
jgi:hypothetical protein